MSTFKDDKSNNVKDGKILSFFSSKFRKAGTKILKIIIKYDTRFLTSVPSHDIWGGVSFEIFQIC